LRRLLKQACLVAATSKRRRYGSTMGEISTEPENLLNRDFSAGAPNGKWLTDITEFQIPAGKVYLSPMIDCFDGMVVSWSIGTRPDAELVNTMLDAAIGKLAASGDRPLVHSDRGGHYRWPGWLSRIAGAKLVRSMSRKGCSPDNAACEGFFGRLKIEMFFQRDWLSTTINEFVAALDAYIRWYNEARIKISLGGLSPAKHRRSLGIAAQSVQVLGRIQCHTLSVTSSARAVRRYRRRLWRRRATRSRSRRGNASRSCSDGAS
jgi:putative transposase